MGAETRHDPGFELARELDRWAACVKDVTDHRREPTRKALVSALNADAAKTGRRKIDEPLLSRWLKGSGALLVVERSPRRLPSIEDTEAIASVIASALGDAEVLLRHGKRIAELEETLRAADSQWRRTLANRLGDDPHQPAASAGVPRGTVSSGRLLPALLGCVLMVIACGVLLAKAQGGERHPPPGPETGTRCGQQANPAGGVTARACVTVTANSVVFALRLGNPGGSGQPPRTELSAYRSGAALPCQVRRAGDGSVLHCTLPRTGEAAAYQASAEITPHGTGQTSRLLSPVAHVYPGDAPGDVRFTCGGADTC
ncbi:hypothetical protein ABZ639_11315 [Saccharomonospora sp. NPDC006951]